MEERERERTEDNERQRITIEKVENEVELTMGETMGGIGKQWED